MDGSGEQQHGPVDGGLPWGHGAWPPATPQDPSGWAHPSQPGTPRGPRWSRLAGGLAAGLLGAATLGGVVGHELFPRVAGGTPSASGGTGGAPAGGTGGSVVPSGEGASPFGAGAGSGLTGSSADSIGSGPADAARVAQAVDPGVVDVNTTIDYGSAAGAGTGIVLTSNGEVLTNNHVVEGATAISVTDVATGRRYPATVVGYDRAKDVAVLQLQGATGLRTARIGASSSLVTGQRVVAVGNANGAGGTPSYAGGTVVALHRSLTASDSLTGTSEQLTGMIKTNADVIPGDSGGPLVDTSGAVVGMDTAGSSTYTFTGASQAAGFAVPIDTAIRVAHAIEAGHASSTVHVGPTAFLGVEIAPAGSASGSAGGGGYGGGFGGYGSGGDGFGGFGGYGGYGEGGSGAPATSGAVVAGVVPNSPAAGAGLGSGDTITAVNGRTVSSPTGLTDALVQDRPGQRVQVRYTDPTGQSHAVTVVLASGPAQ